MKTNQISSLLAVVLISVAMAACVLSIAWATDASQSLGKIDERRLIGRWVRPDGGYVIDIRGVQTGGNLDAAYFNPNPIHVSRAEWRKQSEGLSIFVELNDKNYPGATYQLRYYPESEQLAGEYHQPLVQQTFDVYFTRMAQESEAKT